MNQDDDPYPSSFFQPDSYTCVPTAFAYLYAWQCQKSFSQVLKQLIDQSYQLFDLEKNGMEFVDLKQVCQNLGIEVTLSKQKPNIPSYLTGVKALPRQDKTINQTLKQAEKDGSVIITANEYLYPEGHAVAVFENFSKLKIFDSFLGNTISIEPKKFQNYLETNPTYLVINKCL